MLVVLQFVEIYGFFVLSLLAGRRVRVVRFLYV